MSGHATMESEYMIDGRIHVKHFVWTALAISFVCSLISIAFLPGYFKLIGFILPLLIHALLAFAVHKQHKTALYASFGLMATIYFAGMLSIIIFLIMEAVQNRRGSYKLYILHAASLSGLWTNVLLFLMYGLNKLIKVSQNNYSNFVNEA